MKIILSRKGFDSSNGGIPSPILPDGGMVSLPIPASRSPTRLNDLNVKGYDIVDIVQSLTGKKKSGVSKYVHLDPDIDRRLLANRPKGWKGAFGQVGAAQGHLENAGVGVGDLFIYFGWFREIEKHGGTWKFKRDSINMHAIYGWLFVEEVIPIYGKEKDVLKKYPWLKHHPHLCGIDNKKNTVYVGSRALPSKINSNQAGYGVFNKVKPIQILTDMTQNNKSVWELPICFYPKSEELALSYNKRMTNWKKVKGNKFTLLDSAKIGQEFVLDLQHYPGVFTWLKKLFA